ncbi:hypothetical protein TKK_0017596 [Trichogramma kaykai]
MVTVTTSSEVIEIIALLKDVEKSPYDMLVSQNYDSERISLFPNLDYRQLYGAVSQLIDVLPSVHTGNTERKAGSLKADDSSARNSEPVGSPNNTRVKRLPRSPLQPFWWSSWLPLFLLSWSRQHR